jgi:hypothetical protein
MQLPWVAAELPGKQHHHLDVLGDNAGNCRCTYICTPADAKNADSAKMAKPKNTEINFTPAAETLINEALAIEAEAAADAGALGFMARCMVQATMPHRRVEGTHFERKNGHYTLTMMAPADPGLPFGSIPRLLLAWLSTEAVRTRSREIELGESMSAFMRELGLVPTGGRWGSITRLKNQTARLFACTVNAIYKERGRTGILNRSVADKAVMWWDAKDPAQAGLWKSKVILSEPFFNEIIGHPVPVDLRALKALKQSPLALDTYAWLTYRSSYMLKDSTIPWEALAGQFGCDYARLRDFKAAFLAELRKVSTVYAAAEFEATDAGLIVKPSRSHIPRKLTA